MELKTAELAHDLKMPIQLMYSCIQLLEMEISPDSSARSYLSLLMQSTRQMQMMVANLLDGEQLRLGRAGARLSICDVIGEVRGLCRQCAPLARERGVLLGFSTNVAELRMAIDPEKLSRILMNLVSNALKFTPKGGRVDVSVTGRGDLIEIGVSDTGCGMEAERLERIFECGETDGGHGYGLYIVREYARLLGGDVSVRSVPGVGSSFTVRLPVHGLRGAENVRSGACAS